MIKLDTHPYPVEIWFTSEKKEFLEQRKDRLGILTDLPDCEGCCSYNDLGDIYLVGVFIGDTAKLVHELSHAVIHTFNYIGLTITPTSSESFTYYLESLVRQSLLYLNNKYLEE